ncbi:putative acyl-CoA reductase [Gordonia hirsuta DSM 44140 = NBRC 16056]|uniref:Putative acyl-CoA reductase n=1 Tax=Gordonia hirsuta DSM 44140 = NBRC 16056 TaxID=1121927 RepID=L7LDH3_9ACTN|nr:SDR family NAD(P)-dependent oxidoreductase [Gordonia hirsuta]GAC58083.1 putative acyl-CoA reductase [Gordonia hirsuta DSM 44140 = NBRC 16056]
MSSERRVSSGVRGAMDRVWEARRDLRRFARHNAASTLRLRKLDLVGRIVVITGGSSGIGYATARRCLGAGARVVIVARSAEDLAEARETLSRSGDVHVRTCDVTDEAAVRAMIDEVEATIGPIDVLVNNAGRSIRRSTVNSVERMHDYHRTMDVNYYGAVACTLAVLPKMIERGRGRIVNVSSIATQALGPRFGAYAASKAALDAFGDVLAGEVAGRGITVTSVKMPLTRTPMIEPTGAYRSMSTISPGQAASLVMRGIRYGRPRVSTLPGEAAAAAVALTPGSAAFWRHVDYLAVPESSAALGITKSVVADEVEDAAEEVQNDGVHELVQEDSHV